MALNIIVSGLNEEEVSFIRDASSLFWGEGVVDIKEYQLSDINLVKDLRLQIKDTSLVGVFLAEFSKIPSLEATRSILTSESKFFEVKSTKSLVDYLNSTFGTSFEYTSEAEVGSNDVVGGSSSDFDEAYYKQQLEAKDRQLQAKEGTIRNLEAQLEAQRLSALQDEVLADGIDYGIEIETEPLASVVVEETPEYKALLEKVTALESSKGSGEDKVNRLTSEVNRLKEELSEANQNASNQAGLARSKDALIEDLRSQLSNKAEGISEEELEIRLRDCRLEVTNALNSEKFQLENSLRTQLGDRDSRIAELQSQLDDSRNAQDGVATEYEFKLGAKDQEIEKLRGQLEDAKAEVEKNKFHEHSEYDYKQQISRLREDLEKEKRNVVELNRKMISGNFSEVVGVSPEDWNVQPVSTFFEVVTGDLFTGLVSLKNVEFVFAGSGDSLREGYLLAESMLTRAGGGVILDLSTESTLDYRFGIRKGHEMSNWLNDEPSNIKKYLSKTKHKNIFALGTFKGTFNDLYLAGTNLVPYLQYLDSLGTKVVIFGGTTSSFMGRKLCSSALQVGRVSVVCRSLGTSARTMLFNSKSLFGGTKANYYLSGKLDDMSKLVLSKAKKDGFDWRLLDA
jgi:kinesin K39, putative